jgi:hypothetical protein
MKYVESQNITSESKDVQKTKIKREALINIIIGFVWGLGFLFLWMYGLYGQFFKQSLAIYVLRFQPVLMSLLGDNIISALLNFILSIIYLIGVLVIFYGWVIFIPVSLFQFVTGRRLKSPKKQQEEK